MQSVHNILKSGMAASDLSSNLRCGQLYRQPTGSKHRVNPVTASAACLRHRTGLQRLTLPAHILHSFVKRNMAQN